MLDDIDEATQRLLETAAAFSDEEMRSPSLLPAWSRGHVLTHLARNADSTRNLLTWARTGVETPDYPSLEARVAAVEAGAGRHAAELAADVRLSAGRLATACRLMPPGAWDRTVRWTIGGQGPVRWAVRARFQEILIHHVDLNAGFTAADWPDTFATATLERVVRNFAAGDDAPAMRLHAEETGRWYDVRASGGSPEIHGTVRALVTWLIGRSGGSDLTTADARPLPAVPRLF
ncbi:MAG: maleylpyruvate isomerase family mycothiol-dependent enzyme [Micromonosporaceae bacterium]